MRRIYEINSVRRAGVAGVVAIATVLAGVGVAGAASLGAKSSTHSSTGIVRASKKPTTKTNEGHGFNGVVTSYSAGSITVTNAAGVSATYAIEPSTTYSKDHKTVLDTAIAMAELVRVTATSTSTTTAANIAILADGRAMANEGGGVNGIVTAYVAGTSIAVTNFKGVTTAFLLTATTPITQHHKALTSLALGMRVRVVASKTATTTLSTTATASSVMVLGVAKSNEGHGVNGTVASTYVSGSSSIPIVNDGVSTTYAITAATTFTFGAHKAATASDVTANERVRVIPTPASMTTAAHISILGK